MPRFQACIGPSANRVHIRDTHSQSLLTMCERTAIVQNYKGALSADKLCNSCVKHMIRNMVIVPTVLTAELIGVSEIV